jgi:hypothetical protein
LSSPKRIALSENMAAEWFGFFKLADNDIEKHTKIKFHRRLDPTRTMYEESILFFDSLIRYNRPLLEIVDSRWAPSNRGNKKELGSTSLGPISMYYRKMSRQVDVGTFEFAYKPINSFKTVNDPDLGGMITTGSTLTMTSSKNETSPILRGVWVLENILGMHFKVPANIPALKKDKKRSAIDAVKLHAADKKCAHCHKYIDPIGFSLEAFDQFGNKRKKLTQVIAKLPNGEEFKTPAELKRALLKNYHDDVVKNVIKRFLSYALGRKIEPVDRPAIEKIKQELTKQQFGIAKLIELVATSYPFLHKEGGAK